MSDLIPKQYKTEELVWAKYLNDTHNALLMRYQVTEIVPLCLEEFIKMNSRDLLVTNLSKSHTGSINVLTIESLRAFKRLDDGNSGFTVGTVFMHNIYSQLLSNTNKGYEGFEVIKSNTRDYKADHLQRFTPSNYREEFIFKIKAKDSKKIQIDNASLQMIKGLLSDTEFTEAKKNFKRINCDTRLVGETNTSLGGFKCVSVC